MDNKTNFYKIVDVFCPKIDFQLGVRKQDYNFQQLFKFEVDIVDDFSIKVNFGTGLIEDPEKMNEQGVCRAIVEVSGIVQYSEKINEIKSCKEIPLFANILATLYPFIREKINYCFSYNKVTMLLQPLNLIKVIDDLQDVIIIKDLRQEANK
ncbi:MAG: hypothetical protein JXA66_00800 [Oligoflexia bacterium]|nr:hypothetical protein [Oligoflexia bacterium]